MARTRTVTGGRDATTAVIPGKGTISIGHPKTACPSGYEWRALSEVARLESGHTPARAKPDYWDGAIPWISIPDATGNHGRIIFDTAQHVTEAGVANSSTRLLPVDTVCLSRTASVGYVVQMGAEMCTSQDFVNWVCGPSLNPTYLRYILMFEQESIRRFAYGTTHQTMYYPEAKALHAMLPSRPVQDSVTELLGALDDKIAANGHLVRAADALVSVEFASLASRSPEIGRLTDLAEFVNGRAFTKDASGSGRVVIRIAELNSGIGNSTVRSEAHVGSEHLAGPGDLLFAWSGSLTVHRWYRAEGIVNQHIFKVLPKNGWPTWAVHCALNERLPHFKGVAADRATTMGHIQRRHLEEAIHLPQLVEIQQASTRLDPVWRRALAAEVESEQLALMRDTLLPQLMSGALRVKDAERVVEEVT